MRLLSLFTLLCGTVAVSAGGHAAGACTFLMKSKLSSVKDMPKPVRHQDLTVEVRGGAGPFKSSAVAQFATVITILK
jgi:hypothetical protein